MCLIDLPLTHIRRSKAHFNLRRCDHITDTLINLHWLHVPERTTFKVATLTCHDIGNDRRQVRTSSCSVEVDMSVRPCGMSETHVNDDAK